MSQVRFSEATPGDLPQILQLVAEAFGQQAESDLVRNLDRDGDLTLSTVLWLDDRIIAHAGFSPLTVPSTGDDKVASDRPLLALAPVSVAPAHQKQGHGTSLLNQSHELLKQRGYPGVMVLGEPAYYSRTGYLPASRFGLTCPYEVPAEYFMGLELQPEGLEPYSGTVGYVKAFAELD